MVDGINNITSPQVSGTTEGRDQAFKSVVSVDNRRAQQAKAVEQEVASSVSAKPAAKNAGNAQSFIEAAEKFIDASLPNKPSGTKLRINLDDDSGRFVYQGVDINTGDVVVQFPSEDILKIIAFSRERDGVEGLVVDEEV